MKKSVAPSSTTIQEWTILKYSNCLQYTLAYYIILIYPQASEARRKRIKELGGVRRLSRKQKITLFSTNFSQSYHFLILASPPERPPPFTAPFEGVRRLTCSPILHRVVQCVLKQSAVTSENQVWSDKLLHEVLFLCGLMFIEEDPTEPSSLCKAAIGQYGGNCIIKLWLKFNNNSCFKIRQTWHLTRPNRVICTPAHNVLH